MHITHILYIYISTPYICHIYFAVLSFALTIRNEAECVRDLEYV